MPKTNFIISVINALFEVVSAIDALFVKYLLW